MRNVYDKSKPINDLEGWIVFYGNQARQLENIPAMAKVFQATCETIDLLLELQNLREGSKIK
jgi:hypothetical protein